MRFGRAELAVAATLHCSLQLAGMCTQFVLSPESDDVYELLGVERHADAREIQMAVRTHTATFHPERLAEGDEAAGAAIILRRLADAGELLADTDR